MTSSSKQSEVRRLLAQIEAEYAAAKQGLEGFAQGVSRHQFITARAERAAECHMQLAELLGDECEAIRLIAEHQARRTKTSS